MRIVRRIFLRLKSKYPPRLSVIFSLGWMSLRIFFFFSQKNVLERWKEYEATIQHHSCIHSIYVFEHFVPNSVLGAKNISANKLVKTTFLEVMCQRARVGEADRPNFESGPHQLSSYVIGAKKLMFSFLK